MKRRPQVSARLNSAPGKSQVSILLTAAVMAAVAAAAAAQRQFEELGKRGLPADRENTSSTALGDVDRDGDLDLVVGNGLYLARQSRLYLNNGTGTFTDATASRMPVGSYITRALALGDVDRDGDLDLVVGNYGQSLLYLNNGTGIFTDATGLRMPAGSYNTNSLALGDVDRDGDLDLVVGNGDRRLGVQSRLYLNNGSGTFTDATAARMPAGSYNTFSLAFGDVDRDGDLDLVVGNWQQQSRLYLNNGTGTFTDATATRMPASSYNTFSLALGDVDGDGDLDLVIGNTGPSLLHLNNGTGTFTDATAARMPSGSYSTRSVALGDVDRDGDLDLVVGNRNQQSLLYLNNGAGTFSDVTALRMPGGSFTTTALALGDMDGDDDLDLVVGNEFVRSRLYLNNSTGTFTDATAARMPAGSYGTNSLALGDVDRDGDLDLILGNGVTPGQQSRLYLNNGTGIFTDATVSRMPVGNHYTTSLALGDVDADGDLDLVVGNRIQQSRLYLNNNTGTFTDATVSRMPVGNHYTTSLALGDVDNDGDLDLVVGNGGYYMEQSRLYLNNGAGTFSDATATRMPAGSYSTNSLALGDLDGDGDLDLVIGNTGYVYGGQSRLYVNNGAGSFTDATASRMPVGNYYTSSLALGDVDADGDLDLVVGNGRHPGGQSLLYLNNGTGTFTDATASRMPVGNHVTSSLALGDVDGDGDLDLVVGSNAGHSLLYVNNGAGAFTDATAARMPGAFDYTNSLALGDVDGDGDLDMIVGNRLQSFLYENLLRQLDAPYVLHIGRNYQLDVYSRYGPAATSETAFPFLSTGTANIPFPPFGTIGIDLTQAVALPPFVVPQPAGIGSLTIPIPNLPALAGVTIYAQAVLDQQPVQVRLTNVTGDVTLR